jgi:ATP-dependent RNA helicase SUPV3L1/SUV3
VELHLCGSPAFVEIVHELAKEVGDIVEVRRYERLSPLQPQREAVGSWAEIKPGDCVVAFSRKKLFQLKNEIEVATSPRMKCCIVYGGLPPEARREQARLFNEEGSGWNVLVASDAIGKLEAQRERGRRDLRVCQLFSVQ